MTRYMQLENMVTERNWSLILHSPKNTLAALAIWPIFYSLSYLRNGALSKEICMPVLKLVVDINKRVFVITGRIFGFEQA